MYDKQLVIYDVCENRLEPLGQTIKLMMDDLQEKE